MTYVETRTKHALAVDRGIQAKTVHKSFNDDYAGSPADSDVTNYDTKGTVVLEKPKPKPKSKTEYVPEGSEKAALVKRFHKLPPVQQHKDLLTTRNVIKDKADVVKWHENPRAYDVRGVDTQPKELMEERLKVAHKAGGSPAFSVGNYRWKRRRGVFRHFTDRSAGKGHVKVDAVTKKEGTFFRTVAHEFGHAFDRNVIGSQKGNERLTTGNVNFHWLKAPKMIGTEFDDGQSFGKVNNKLIQIHDIGQKNARKVIDVTEKKISPYNISHAPFSYMRYRRSNEELFADWFSGLVVDKGVVKRKSRGFYNMFKKSHKPLIRELKASDKRVTKKYMKGVF